MSVKPSRKVATLQRRQRVADLYLKGYGQAGIANELAVRQSTISSDIKLICTAWRESSIRDFDAARDLELERIARIEREAWAAYERSQQPVQIATVDGQAGSSSQKAKRTVRHQYGDPRFLEVILHCGEARRQLLGLDAPTKVAATTPDGKPLTLEERRLHINAIVVEHYGIHAALLPGSPREETDHGPRAISEAAGELDGPGADAAQPAAHADEE
jgi:hypothetical protein